MDKLFVSALVLLFFCINSASTASRKGRPGASSSSSSCEGVDDCWVALYDEISSPSSDECKAWRRYSRCLRMFQTVCKEDFYFATQLESVRRRIRQMACSRSAKSARSSHSTKNQKNYQPPAAAVSTTGNARHIFYRSYEPGRRLRSHKIPSETLVCQVFGYGHLRTFSGDVITCGAGAEHQQHDRWNATLFEIAGAFNVRAHYQKQQLAPTSRQSQVEPIVSKRLSARHNNFTPMSLLQNVSVSFVVNGSTLGFHLVPSDESNVGIAVSVGLMPRSLAEEVALDFGASDDTFSVVDVNIKRVGLRLRVRRRRNDKLLHSVTLLATTTQGQILEQRSKADLCVSGCNYDGTSAKRIDLAQEISRKRWAHRDIGVARRACTSALNSENEYLSPCVFDHLSTSMSQAGSQTWSIPLCHGATPQCAKTVANDLAHLVNPNSPPNRWSSFYEERVRVSSSATSLSSSTSLLIFQQQPIVTLIAVFSLMVLNF